MRPDGDELDRTDENGRDAQLAESEAVRERDFYGKSGDGAQARSSEHLWLISYSDFMTILMIFFLAMYGHNHLTAFDPSKSAQADRFGVLVAEIKEKVGDDVRVIEERDKVTVELGEGILFGSGQAELNGAARRTLADIGSSIKSTAGDIIVEGHTDNVPVTGGRYASNWELSAARAFSVIQELKKAGVPADRLAAWGFGENRPVGDNTTAGGRERNRRIDIVILKKRLQNA